MTVYNWAFSILFPPRCALCNAPGHDDLDLCRGCRADLPWLHHCCAGCALPLAADAHETCPRCLRRPPPYAGAVSALRYEAPVDWLITRLKFHRQLSHARVLGALLAQCLGDAQAPRPDRILPVPLHPARRAQRGFNQAAEIARVIGRRLDIRCETRLAWRTRDTPHQLALPARERRANVRGAFAAAAAAKGARIAIVDDVVTTGQTVAELTRALHRAGAQSVHVWSVARAL